VAGKLGSAVTILGNNLTGATSVKFNGKTATFTVLSATSISATVPAGATTGIVQVATPAGVVSSNVPFRVMP
jgi:IPT/TIG domain